MTPAISTSPRTWTLRFKHHRRTLLLHVDPLQKLPLVRAELLKAIQQTCPDGQLDGLDIPNDSDEILLARLVDSNNLRAGWKQMEKEDEDLFDDEDKGKGKAKASTKSKGKGIVEDCPQAAGLKDGGIVAFKFRREMPKDGAERLDGEPLIDEPETWDVLVPSMEETYGDHEEGVDAR